MSTLESICEGYYVEAGLGEGGVQMRKLGTETGTQNPETETENRDPNPESRIPKPGSAPHLALLLLFYHSQA